MRIGIGFLCLTPAFINQALESTPDLQVLFKIAQSKSGDAQKLTQETYDDILKVLIFSHALHNITNIFGAVRFSKRRPKRRKSSGRAQPKTLRSPMKNPSLNNLSTCEIFVSYHCILPIRVILTE